MSSHGLDRYHRDFSAYLISGDASALQTVFPDPDQFARAAVYRNGFFRSCVDALRSNYPTVNSLVGEGYFDSMAQAFVKSHPPRQGTLVGYGEAFPEWLIAQHSMHQLDYLASFAMLDRAWTRVYFAADDKPLTVDDVQHHLNSDGDLSLLNVACVSQSTVIALDYRILDAWSQLKSSGSIDQATQVERTSIEVLLWRDAGDQVLFKALTRPESTFFSAIGDEGSLLGEAMAAAVAEDDQFDVSQFFSSLLTSGAIRLAKPDEPT